MTALHRLFAVVLIVLSVSALTFARADASQSAGAASVLEVASGDAADDRHEPADIAPAPSTFAPSQALHFASPATLALRRGASAPPDRPPD